VVVGVIALIVLITVPVVATIRSRDRSKPAVGSPGRTVLAGFGEAEVRLVSVSGGQALWCLLLATSPAQRERGLMYVGVSDLRGHGGMLFSFPQTTTETFWMRNTRIPLSVAFFDADGRFVSKADMAPCGDRATCPTYAATAPYLSALEVPQGRLGSMGIGPGARLTVTRTLAPACSASALPKAS
jgi:uncharacterized membrane protein (UPF0127 family)